MWDIIANSPLRLIAALVIGLLTAWWIWGRLGSVVSDTADKAGGMAKGAAGAAGGVASGAVGAVKDTASKAADAAGDVTSGAVDTAKDAGSAVAGGVAAVGSGAAAAATGAKDKVADMLDKPKIAAAVGEPDDLTRIKGIGPKLNDLCHSLGVMRFDQIAAWKKADVKEVDQYLKIKGRIERDQWVAQAKLLARGDDAGHKKKFG